MKHNSNLRIYQPTFNHVVVQYFKAGAKEVHLIFDKFGKQKINLKVCEHYKQYKTKSINQY